MISIIIPTYRNPKYLDICLQSAIEQADSVNEIIVAVDGFIEESQEVLDKYSKHISVLNLGQNQGMQTALNLGVMNASNEILFIVNDDNVFCKGFDTVIKNSLGPKHVLTLNQIEPTGPGIFNFPVKDFGRNPEVFKYEEFVEYEQTLRENKQTSDGGIFPFAISKKDYMIVGGFDTMYKSPFICDWDFFLKLDLNHIGFTRTHMAHLYHFGSTATKNGNEGERFKLTEGPAAQMFMYKWGIAPQLFDNNSHNPKDGSKIKGIKFN
jgi:glycosyltransferase involved in cell wall biosynthesis